MWATFKQMNQTKAISVTNLGFKIKFCFKAPLKINEPYGEKFLLYRHHLSRSLSRPYAPWLQIPLRINDTTDHGLKWMHLGFAREKVKEIYDIRIYVHVYTLMLECRYTPPRRYWSGKRQDEDMKEGRRKYYSKTEARPNTMN